MRIREHFKRHSLWLGLAAVLAPLAVLLALQYRWLVELEGASVLAREATLDNYLETATEGVELYYKKNGERVLNLPAWLFTERRLYKAAAHFANKLQYFDGAESVFVVSFLPGEDQGTPQVWDPASGELIELPWSPRLRSLLVAIAPWHTLAHKGGKVESPALTVDERDPQMRILLNPITDEASRLVGMAGMVLDQGHFLRQVLPEILVPALPRYFPEASDGELSVAVRDGRGRQVWDGGEMSPAEDAPAEDAAIDDTVQRRSFSFVFTDWSLELASRQATPGQWARTNFRLNIALSAALGLALLGGVVLALRTASREMRLSQMKSDFVSNVSHELRTPLASIRVFGELLRLGRVDSGDKVREYGEYIETESRRLTQLIHNLLDFSSIESGRKTYHFEPTDVEQVVAETLRTFTVRLRQRGFRIAYEGPREPLPPVRLDAAALGQSVSNLVDNAVKYSDGSREIAVSVKRRGSSVVIAVQDWGLGIPRDEQVKIFERFHRVSTGLVHDVKGSGLGLSIVQHIVRAHGGEVTVESRPGQGSTFSIHLPLEPVVAGPAATAPGAAPIESSDPFEVRAQGGDLPSG